MQPCIVVASCCPTIIPSDLIIKDILEVQELPEPLTIVDGVRSYPWHITTKYYETDVQVCSMDEKTLGSQTFAERVNAVILCFDSNSSTGLSLVEQWLTFTKEFEPEVNILICDRCSDSPTFTNQEDGSVVSGISKIAAQNWCVKHNFELVELNPLEDDDADLDDDFPESLGMKRVIQALHAHIWPNLKLKEILGRSRPNPGFQSALNDLSGLISGPSNEINGDDYKSQATGLGKETVEQTKIAKVKPMSRRSYTEDQDADEDGSLPTYEEAAVQLENQSGASGSSSVNRDPRRSEKIEAMLEAVDALPEENFEQLFQNLSSMKEKAEGLSPSQRRAYAEKMTLAFWRSIGGCESEIDGLSSSDEEAAQV